MSDFASAAMVRVLAQGMRELGLDPTPGLPPSAHRDARVDLDLKRALVASALNQAGIGCLARLGRGLHRLAHEPTHRALVSARSPADLFGRWARLERYIHSRHRIEVTTCRDGPDGGQARIRHVAVSGAPPLAAEDLVVLGVLAALLEALGAKAITATAGGAAVLPEPDVPALERAVARHMTARWTLCWRAGAGPGHCSASQPSADSLAWPGDASPVLRRVVAALRADLMQPPTLPFLASAVGNAPRSLQRSLAQEGWTVTRLLGELRCREAAAWLLHSSAPLAEVGFVCGYADQPHFTREFRMRVGLTPAAYRTAFGTTPQAPHSGA